MEDFFKFKSPDRQKCERYGFFEKNGELVYKTELLGGQFFLTVKLTPDGVKTSLLDAMTGEPYTLHLVEEAAGAFVGSVREAYAAELTKIAERCFVTEIFRCEQTKRFIAHVAEMYGDSPEYLWEKFPDNVAVRRGDNGKWYAVLLTVERKKLGLAGEGKAEILDVRADPAKIDALADGKKYFRGYHMNKTHWMTVALDGTLPDEEIFALTDESYRLAK